MLYLLSRSPFQCDLNAILRLLAEGDDLLLLQDGVLAALHGTPILDALLNNPCALYALHNDVLARGLSARLSPNVQVIDYNEFVLLTVKHPQQITW